VTTRVGDDDADAFAEATRGAKPLAPDGRDRVAARPAPRGAPPRLPRTRVDETHDGVDALGASTTFEIATVGDAIAGRGVGVDAKLLRRLKAGEPPVQARLDLHGRPRREAQGALERFVRGAREQGKRCVLVIHGRGAHSADDAPVLKPMVWRWLAGSAASAAAVLAFASARAGEGGDGATRVLLRRSDR
jgi:DNA-nicking Smr family endonuclease